MSFMSLMKVRPSLLLRPEGSYSRQGEVSPNVMSGISVVQGVYGQAWQANSNTSLSIDHIIPGEDREYTVIVRCTPDRTSFALRGTTDYYFLQGDTEGAVYEAGGGYFYVPIDLYPTPYGNWGALTWSDKGGVSLHLPEESGTGALDIGVPHEPVELEFHPPVGGNIESVVVFHYELSREEIERVVTMPEAWTFENLSNIIERRIPVDMGTVDTSLAAVEPVVYITDRDNEAREYLPGLDTVQPDWDIDRAGSKGRVEITTYQDVLEDYMWIAPVQRIIPEVGDIIEQQLGHFRLDRPSDVVDGTMGSDGTFKVMQEATGADIIDDIANTNLQFTFYTPRRGNVMSDVHFLIKMATMGVIEPIPIANPSFEETPAWTGWSTGFYGGGGGSFTHVPGSSTISIADGDRAWGTTFTEGPADAYSACFQYVDVPKGVDKMMLTGLFVRYRSEYAGDISLQFRDEDNNIIGSNIGERLQPRLNTQWHRALVVADVPDNATRVRVYVGVRKLTNDSPFARPMWDDVRLFSITNDPIPDSRINLPESDAYATNRIQTTSTQSIGYTAINEHRLNAISHHALFTELDGKITTAPARNPDKATVTRSFGIGDYESVIVGEVETSRAARRPYNHFQAIKEDLTGEGVTLVANAYNVDPNDRRSIHRAPLNSAPPIQVPDAVDQAELQAVADAARDRESENETLRLRIRPGVALRVHDVIEVESSHNPRAIGRWLVEYIRPGMTPDDPLVEIGARRARTQEVS